MANENKTYAIVDWSAPLTTTAFNVAKTQGLIQSRLNSVRKSIDSTRAILKWIGVKPAAIPLAKIVWSGSHSETLTYLQANKTQWFALTDKP